MGTRPLAGPRVRSRSTASGDGPSLGEGLWVWALFALVALAIVITYARLPPSDFYNVSEDGIDGGLGRALVFTNFPWALAAIALVALPIDMLDRRWADGVGILAVLLCLVVAAPGVVEQDDLDAKALNAVPASGVLLVFGLTLAAVRRGGVRGVPAWTGSDWARVAIAVLLLLTGIPWIAAELGLYAELGGIFFADDVVPEAGHPELRAVHVGHHHGLDGVLFALTALALSRELSRFRRPPLRLALAGYLSLMLVYGLANALQDFWLEQVVKRGASSFRFPDMLRPDLGPEWLGIVLASAAVYALLAWPLAARPPRP